MRILVLGAGALGGYFGGSLLQAGPAVDARTAVLPVLNGISPIETLQRSFGAERVLGGIAKIQATLAPDGAVRHLNDWRYLTFGEMDGRTSQRVEALAEAASGARGVV